MKATILISSAGRRGQLIGCFRDSARVLGVELRVLAVDLQPELSAACQLADRAFAVPRCTDAAFVPALLELCEREGVALLVPTIDTELPALSQHRDAFAAIGTTVAVSSSDVVAIARDKGRTAGVLQAAGVLTPRTLSAAEFNASPAGLAWPVILKPRSGSSSVGILRPATSAEAQAAIAKDAGLIVQELWHGKEYTVNVFADREGRWRCAVPHWRIETRTGEVSKGRTEDVPVLRETARTIIARLGGARGALCFQAIVDERRGAAVFEINARFGGGYPLAHRADAPFAQWLLEEVLGRPVTAHDNWRPGVTMLRYDEAVFINV